MSGGTISNPKAGPWSSQPTGPCHGCGVTGYGPSTSGPNYCGSCACGIPPEQSRLTRALHEANSKVLDMHLALTFLLHPEQKMFNTFPGMKDRAEALVERYKRDLGT